MMSSRYPILDNRPIDQWKVTELKEELKRRKLATKGLKDDLIKRLDEAIRIERKAAEKDEANAFDPDLHPVVGVEDSDALTATAEIVNKIEGESPLTVETAAKGDVIVEPIKGDNAGKIPEVLGDGSDKNDKLDGVTTLIDIDNSLPALGEVSQKDLPSSIDSVRVGWEIAHGSVVETSITVTEGVITEVVVSGLESHSMGTQKENGNSATKWENEESKAWLEDEDSKPQLDQDIDLLHEGAVPHSSAPVNQVSEVNPSLGSLVKSNSVSSDSVSINEKIELKDNILADNVKLEQDIVRPEMVEPSSSNSVPVFDESHSMNVEELHEKKSSVKQNRNVTSPDLSKTNSSEDGGYTEKLNIDRSSGDDSMEEDLPESKQFNSKFNADEPREKRESCEVLIVKDDNITKVLEDGLSARTSDTLDETAIHSVEKRKFLDQASVGNNESAKRQWRWNSETVKLTDPQSTNLPPAATHKNEPVALKPNFSSSDSLATDEAPRERIVPPPQMSPTNSLRIDHFLRPFTLKAVQELLGKTGNVTSFWMDHIKTHCYVTYSSVEEAIGTRNAVYNLQWPSNGGRLLVAEFVDPQEVKMKLEPPLVQAASVSSGPAVPPVPPASQPEPSVHQNRELPPVSATLPPHPPLSKAPPAAREWLPLPPPLPEKVDPPIVTLDDLFRKTSATPRIYYLPLSEEQVAAKLAAHGKSSKQ